MCGINGLITTGARRPASAVIEKLVASMNQAIAHRGPDGQGIYVDDGIGFGHRRLAVIDLSDAGAQPMFNADRSLVLVYNGEIYNYLELIPELRAAGYEFRTRTDSEVVLHAYAEWGEECVKRFNGMWAFAIWDVHRRRLFASRDRFGVKPFVYMKRGDEFVFSSEVAGILAARPVTDANLAKLHDYLAYGYRTNNGETFFAGIHDLPPAHNLVLKDGELILSRYWRLPPRALEGSKDVDAVERLRALVKDAVRLRFRSDVPVALLQSGGLDSSVICKIVDDAVAAGRLGCDAVTAFTAVFPGKPFDESAWVHTLMAGCRHVRLVEIEPGAEELGQALPRFVRTMGEPVFSTTSFAHWRLMNAIREHGIKVVINGQGADEAFAGYGRSVVGYRLLDLCISRPDLAMTEAHAIHQKLGFSYPMLVAQFFKALFGRRAASKVRARYVEHSTQMLDPGFRKAHDDYLRPQAATMVPGNLDRHLRGQLLHYGFNQILQYEDQSSMSQGIEIRSPFIDYRLMEFAFSLPDHMKISAGVTKRLIRNAFVDQLPETIVNQSQKIGFRTPFDEWIATPRLWKVVADLIDSPEFGARRIWRADRLRARLSSPRGAMAPFPLWRYINVELWARQFAIANI